MTRRKPFVLGLTGSIAMGKSTTAQMFRDAGIPVWDADATVHKIYGPGGVAIEPLGRLVPTALTDHGIDRNALSAAIAGDPTLLGQIEYIVHPLVAKDRQAFLEIATDPIVVLDIPLLFEAGTDDLCDAIVVVTAPADIQRTRALARPGMTEDRFDMVLSRQIPDADKRARADYIIDTSKGLEAARQSVQALLAKVQEV